MTEQTNYTIKDIDSMTKSIEIRLDTNQFNTEIEEEIRRYCKKVKTKGFRQGKTPPNIVRKMYGEEIHERARSKLINDIYVQAIKEKKLEIDNPFDTKLVQEPNKKHAGVYQLIAEVIPQFDPSQVSELQCTLVEADVLDDDVDQTIEQWHQGYKQWQAVEGSAELGHRLDIEFTLVFADPELQKKYQGEKIKLQPILGQDTALPELSTQLIGATVGDHKELAIEFAKDHKQAEIAGQSCTATVDILKVEEGQLPELTEEFLISVGAKNQDDFRANMKEFTQVQATQMSKAINQRRIMTSLQQQFPLQFPPNLVSRHVQRLLNSSPNKDELPSPEKYAEAERYVRTQLNLSTILSELARHYKVKIEPEQMKQAILARAQQEQNPKKAFTRISKTPREWQAIENHLIEDSIFDHIIKGHTKEKTHHPFFEIQIMYKQPDYQPPSQSTEATAPTKAAEVADSAKVAKTA